MSVKVESYATIPLDSLQPYEKNPRKGDIKAIAESLKVNGQYKPIIVRTGSNEILVGNHTWKAAKSLGWDEIAVGYVKVSDRDAKRIMLADNRTSDAATYDYELLAEIIAELPDVEGTGYTEEDRTHLMESIEAAQEDTTRSLVDLVHETPSFGIIEPPTELDTLIEEAAGEPGTSGIVNADPTADETLVESLDDVSSDLEGILALKEDILWPIENYYGIPTLRRDMLLERKDLPDPIQTWGGKDATPDDGSSWYWYNYGVDSAAGLPWDRSILGFYTHDFHFENWWKVPAHYLAKVMNAGITIASTPNFSLWASEPRVLQFWQVYRARWMGRYFQEGGIKIIPDVNWSDEDSLEWSMTGIPQAPPVISVQVQTIDRFDKKDLEVLRIGVRGIVDKLEPETLLVYGGKTGHKEIKKLKLGCEVIYLDNRATVRRGVAFDASKGYDITGKTKPLGPNKAAVDRY